ncbi:hypothetical protein CAP35_13470 [Chitinophagaceae bacterium IBVUCB1]|nr:hypothetical protein CAP35_13470 [Chitinophagaceae bacterium IBVUCB1]
MNDNYSHINEEVQVKYLLGEATPQEREQVEQWAAASEANAKQLEQLRYIWAETKKLEARSSVDENIAWQNFKQRIATTQQTKTIPLGRRTYWLRVAATLLLMIGGSWMAYYYLYSAGSITLNSGNTVLAQTLPDGTTVTLNKNATIKYPKQFKGDTREVVLEGEAFFDVSPDKQKPFIIHANEADVEVVGTSFNVKTNSSKTEVIVETGVVQVSKNLKGVVLNPKEKATVQKNAELPVKEVMEDELHSYYRTKEFVCSNTPLSRLVPVLNEAYGVEIVIANDELNNLRLTTTFHNQSLGGILNVLSETFNIQVSKKDGQIILQ